MSSNSGGHHKPNSLSVNSKHTEERKQPKIRFDKGIMLLEAAARNDVAEGRVSLSMCNYVPALLGQPGDLLVYHYVIINH